MAFFSALAGAASAAFTFATSTAIGQVATGMAVNALASALSQPQQAGRQTPGIELQVRQGIVPRSFILGHYATAGSLVYHTTTGIGADDPNELYVAVYALSDLPVRGLRRIWIDGKECTVDGSAGADPLKGNLIPEFADDEDDDGQIKAWIKFYDGTQTQADQYLIDHCSSDERPWTADHVGYGIAYAILTFDYDPNLFQGFPKSLFELNGIPLDQPGDSTRTDLPAAQIYTLLKGVDYDGEWLYGPQVQPALDAEHWTAAIMDCQRQHPDHKDWSDQAKIDAFGSTTIPPRYRSGAEVQVDRPVSEVIENLLSACNGRMAETAGEYRIQVGNPPPQADFTFTDDDILLTSEQSFSPFLPLAETVNAVTAVYPDPAQQYEDNEPDPLYTPAYEAEDGNRRLTTTTRLDAVTSGEQVQRLMKSALAEARRARRHTLRMPPDYWRVEPGQYAGWTSERNGYLAKLFRVDGVSDEPNGDVTLDLTEVDPSDYDFGEIDFTPTNSQPIQALDPVTYVVPGFAVEPYTIRRDNGEATRPGIRMSWDSARPGRGLIYRIYAAGTNDTVTRGRVAYDDGEHVSADGISAGAALEVQVRREMRNGRTPWSRRYAVTAPDVRLGEEDLRFDFTEKIDNAVGDARDAKSEADNVRDSLDTMRDRVFNDPDSLVEKITDIGDEVDGYGGNFSRIFGLNFDEESAFATLIDQLEVNADGTSSVVQTLQDAYANEDGSALAGWLLDVQAGSTVTSIDLVSADGENTTSTITLDGDEVIAPGTLIASNATITDVSNMVPYGNAKGGQDRAGRVWTIQSGANIVERTPGASDSARANIPGTHAFHAFSTDNAEIRAPLSEIVSVKPGEEIYIDFQHASTGSSRQVQVRPFFYDNNGEFLTPRSVEANTSSSSWREASGKITVPSGASGIGAWQVRFPSGGSGRPYVTDIRANRRNAAQLIVDGGITARHIDTVSLRVAGLSIFGGDLRSNNYRSGRRGWRLDQNGDLEIWNLIVRGSIQEGAVSNKSWMHRSGTRRAVESQNNGEQYVGFFGINHDNNPRMIYLGVRGIFSVYSPAAARLEIYEEPAGGQERRVGYCYIYGYDYGGEFNTLAGTELREKLIYLLPRRGYVGYHVKLKIFGTTHDPASARCSDVLAFAMEVAK